MRQVTGWLTEDNQFFALREAAVFYEATEMLKGGLLAFAGPKADFDKFVFVVNNLRPQIKDYLDAAQALQASEEADTFAGVGPDNEQVREEPDSNPPDLGIGEVLHETDVQQSTGGLDAVSNMGTSALSQALRDVGEGDGFGGRGVDAQGLFSGADLATVATPEAGEARHGNRDEALWKAFVDRNFRDIEVSVSGTEGSSTRNVLRDIAQHGLGRQPG